MRGYDRDRYGSSLRLGPKPATGQTQQAKPPTWIPLESSDANSYNPQTQPPTPIGYRPDDMAVGANYAPNSIAGMLQGGSSNDAIRDMILRKMIYGG